MPVIPPRCLTPGDFMYVRDASLNGVPLAVLQKVIQCGGLGVWIGYGYPGSSAADSSSSSIDGPLTLAATRRRRHLTANCSVASAPFG